MVTSKRKQNLKLFGKIIKFMTEQEMVSEIIRIETICTRAVLQGHKASNDDVYQPLREKAKHYREKLGIK